MNSHERRIAKREIARKSVSGQITKEEAKAKIDEVDKERVEVAQPKPKSSSRMPNKENVPARIERLKSKIARREKYLERIDKMLEYCRTKTAVYKDDMAKFNAEIEKLEKN